MKEKPMKNEDNEESHESYVMVGFSRITGNPGPLFGSPIADHPTFVELRVTRATCRHDLGRDWIHGNGRPLLTVRLSSNQFSELLTTMNIGNGVPGTMAVFDGMVVPRPPAVHREIVAVRDAFREKMEELAAEVKRDRKEIEELIAKKSLTLADRNVIKQKLEKIDREIGANAPFVFESFEKAAARVVTAAKSEVDAFVTQAVVKAGMQALDMVPQMVSGEPVPSLVAGELLAKDKAQP